MRDVENRSSWLLEVTLEEYNVEVAAAGVEVAFASGGQKSHDGVLGQKVVMAFHFAAFVDVKIALERVLDLKAKGVTAKLRER